MPKKILLDSKKIEIILSRLVYELIENHKDFHDTVLLRPSTKRCFIN